MIVSASYRTDIPAFYGAWFEARLTAGQVRVRNPYGGAPYTVRLDAEAADSFVFWTRNVAPFLPVLDRLARQGRPFVVQFTVTGYPHALETSVIDPAKAIAQIRELGARFGPRVVVWRYDPILDSSLTPAPFHRRNFEDLARRLEGASDEVVVSFAHIYRKTRANLMAAARRYGFAWSDPDAADKRATLAALAEIAAGHGMGLTVCSQADITALPATPARCIDAARLGDVAGREIAARQKGNRPGCRCAESRDIGAYDTCPHGCVYCYAVASRRRAQSIYRAHDVTADGL